MAFYDSIIDNEHRMKDRLKRHFFDPVDFDHDCDIQL